MVFLLNVFRCSGCTHEWNLDRPPVIEEAIEFFKSLGVSDFTFESGRLVGVPSVCNTFFAQLLEWHAYD